MSKTSTAFKQVTAGGINGKVVENVAKQIANEFSGELHKFKCSGKNVIVIDYVSLGSNNEEIEETLLTVANEEDVMQILGGVKFIGDLSDFNQKDALFMCILEESSLLQWMEDEICDGGIDNCGGLQKVLGSREIVGILDETAVIVW